MLRFEAIETTATKRVQNITDEFGSEFVPEDLLKLATIEQENISNVADANEALEKVAAVIQTSTGIDIETCDMIDMSDEPTAIRMINIRVILRDDVVLAIVRTYNSIEVSIDLQGTSYWLCKVGRHVELAQRISEKVKNILATENCPAETRAFTAWFVAKFMEKIEATFPKTERGFGL